MMALTRDRLIRPFFHATVRLLFFGISLMAAIHLWHSHEAIHEGAFGQLETALLLEEKRLRDWIDSRRSDALFLARLDETQALLQDPQDTSEEEVETAPNTASAAPMRDDASFRRLLVPFLESRPDLRELQILSNPEGRIVFSTLPENQGAYRTRDRFFQEGHLSLWMQAAYISPQTLESTITLATPIGTSSRLGVLAIHLDPSKFKMAANWEIGLGKSGEISLVDEFEEVIPAEVETPFYLKNDQRVYTNSLGVKVLGAHRRLPDLQLVLLAEIPQSEVHTELWSHQIPLATFTLFVAFVLSGVARGAFGRIADRLFDGG